jgi:hypothetical protein
MLGQHNSDTANTAHTRNTLFISILGNSGLYALGFDHSWRKERAGKSVSIGGGYDRWGGQERIAIPVQWNWFHGRKGRLEHGLGVTYLDGFDWVETSYLYNEVRTVSRSIWLVVKPIAYRLQGPRGRFFFRAQTNLWVKCVELDPDWMTLVETKGEPHATVGPRIGVDIGYTFK